MADNVLPIRADISPALRPEVLDKHANVLTGRAAPVLNAARQSLTTLCQQMALIHDARRAAFDAHSNPNALRQLQAAKDGRGKAPPNTYMARDGQMALTLPLQAAREFNTAADAVLRRPGRA